MIRAFRKLGDTWVFKAIMVLAILSFVSLWGVGGIDNIFSATNQAAVTMDGAEITGSEIIQEFERETNKYRKLVPMGFSYQDALRMGLLQESLYNAIYNKVMEQIAANNDMLIPDDIVFEYIRSNPEFMGDDRYFSRDKFLNVLRESGLTEQEFIKIAKDDLLENYILDTNRAFPYAPEKMLELIIKQRTSKRNAIIVDIKTKNLKLPNPPSEEELQGFYEENQDQYMTPEYRDFSVAVISYNDILKNVNIPEEELKEVFDAEKSSFDTPETRHVYGLEFSEKDEKIAVEAIEELKNNTKTFKQVANEKLSQFNEEYDWGFMAKDFLIEELKDVVFSAKKNEIIGPIKTMDNKIYVLQISAIKPFKSAVYKDKRSEILERLKNERSEELTYNLIEAIEEDVGIDLPLQDIAKKHGMKLSEYKNKTIEDSKIDETIKGTVFSLEEGETSGVMDTKGGLFVAKNNGITEPKLKDFSSVKKQVKASLEGQMQEDVAKNLVVSIVNDANKNGVSKAIKNKSLNGRFIHGISYNDEKNEILSKNDVIKLFELSQGEVFYKPTANGYMIVGLSDIRVNNNKVAMPTQSKIKNDVEDSIIKSLEQQFYMDYASELNVKTNQYVIENSFKSVLGN